MKPRIALLDYGIGNLHSVCKALEHVGAEVVWLQKPGELEEYDGMILPGVGHFGDGIRQIRRRDLDQVIRQWIAGGKPLLGICLGLQMLFDASDEDPDIPGLGIFPGRVRKFTSSSDRRVPQMGWNQVTAREDCPLFNGIAPGSYFYFVHSYYVEPDDPAIIGATTEYGVKYCCFGWNKNVYAAQFHPEKSQKNGLRMLTNFVNLL